MKPAFSPLALGLLLAALCLAAPARAGDEDVKQEEKQAAEQKAPEDTAIPKEAEAPDLSMDNGEEPAPPTPTPVVQESAPAATPAPRKRQAKAKDLDENVDYSRLLNRVNPTDPSRGVLPPAQGFRGYRSNMVAVGAGDRTPGFGAIVEYNWNRIGLGGFASYLNTSGQDAKAAAFGFAGAYGLYRWLPFDISPYFLMGVELGSQTDETLGGLTGGGVEARIYSGWTALLGWTFHSTAHRGFWGGAFGWSF